MDTDVFVAGVLAGVAALLVLAYFTRVPYPILLVLGCAGIGFLPHAPHLELEPDLVLLILLPPLLYAAAFFSSLRDLQRNLRAISLLSIGLVVFTTLAVAWIAHALVGLSWEAAFVLGAVVSPTDPVAATAIGRRVGAPRRVIAVVEGERLVNDSTALIAHKLAIAAAGSRGRCPGLSRSRTRVGASSSTRSSAWRSASPSAGWSPRSAPASRTLRPRSRSRWRRRTSP